MDYLGLLYFTMKIFRLVRHSMTKKLLENLNSETFCRIKPSKLHGVGVFAIRDIPKNVNPFRFPSSACGANGYSRIHKDSVQSKEVRKLLDDFLGQDTRGYYDVPKNGLNSLDLSFYINHSDTPNMKITEDAKCEFVQFKTNRIIKKGEELLIDYREYN